MLSSANSINIGRLAPQVVYYFRAYGDLVKSGRIRLGDVVDYTVPTGNFGDILAGYFARQMGLPVGRLICASNANDVLTEFLTTGRYDKRRPFYKTTSPSMDILVSSNLERLLYLVSQDASCVERLMRELNTQGWYQVSGWMLEQLRAVVGCGCCADVGGASTSTSATPTPPWPGPWRRSTPARAFPWWSCPPPRPTSSPPPCCTPWARHPVTMSSP